MIAAASAVIGQPPDPTAPPGGGCPQKQTPAHRPAFVVGAAGLSSIEAPQADCEVCDGGCPPDPVDGEQKAFDDVAARAALAGCSLYRLAGGGFLLGRWQFARELPDLRAVRLVLTQLAGGRS